jgi:PLP dependent protein
MDTSTMLSGTGSPTSGSEAARMGSIRAVAPLPSVPAEVRVPASEQPQPTSPTSTEGIHTPDTPAALEARYRAVQARIAAAARRVGRDPSRVVLVAVSKYAEPDQIRHLIRLGHRDLGENYVQNLVQRAAMVDEMAQRGKTLPNAKTAFEPAAALGLGATASGGKPGEDRVRWHVIGPMQRNKIKKALEFARLIHTVDSLRVAEEIQILNKKETPVEVLVQVNCSGEEQKHGVPPPAALHLCEQIDTMLGVRVRGLMTMAAYNDEPEKARPAFRMLRELFEEIKKTGVGDGQFNILSMGMSGDFEVAIEEGSNMVRVGSAIFGERTTTSEEPDEPETPAAE